MWEQPECQQAGDVEMKRVICPLGLACPMDPHQRLDGKTVAGLVHFSDLQADISRLLPASVVADTEFY